MVEEKANETEILSAAQGKERAEAWRKNPQVLDIPNTLLTSAHITEVVQKTGLISPFYLGSAPKSRLKKAAYEGRVGTKAFIFKDKNCPERIFDSQKDDYLLVPKNSIVFVESDLNFRIPDFIALRFNLQIKHVHRGLLLGTGPLIDPGYWGKLCIPLHNLTDQDYEIPKNEGLIWLEFTKTTLSTDKADDARPPLSEGEHWDIEVFLNKAASQYRGYKVPIRSSLPTMFDEANAAAKKSADDAKSALEVAEKFRSLNNIAMVAAAVGLCAICFTAAGFLFNLSSRNEDIATKLKSDTEAVRASIDSHVKDIDLYGGQPSEARASIPALRNQINQQRVEIDVLKTQVEEAKSQLVRLQQERNDRLIGLKPLP